MADDRWSADSTTLQSTTDGVKLAKLLDWLQEEGGQLHSGIRFGRLGHAGLSAYCTVDLSTDSPIIAVPKSACITTSVARTQIADLLHIDEAGAELDQAPLHDKEWILLYLVLHKVLLEQEREDEGSAERSAKRTKMSAGRVNEFLKHAAYIDILPNEILTPLHFKDVELQLLRSTPLHGHAILRRYESRMSCRRAVELMRKRLSSMKEEGWAAKLLDRLLEGMPAYDEGKEPTLNAAEEEKHWGVDENDWPALSTWRWAETAHGSRAFPARLLLVNSAPVLIPCLDLFNHSRQSRVTWALNGHAEKGELVTFTLHNAVRAGEQVFNSYGPKSNEDLLASYGFVDEGMHDDAVTLKLGGGQLQIAPDEDRAKVDQHYWRYGEACPTSLLSQVEELLRCQDDVEQEASHAQADLAPENRAGLDSLMRKGEALEMIVELLQRKREGFLSSQRAVEKLFACADGADAEEMVAIRPSVAQNVQIYRKGQERILRWALSQAEEEENAVADQIEALYEKD